jgi:hypothetical protein
MMRTTHFAPIERAAMTDKSMLEKLEANKAEIEEWEAALHRVGDRGSPAAIAIRNHLDALTVDQARLHGLSEDDIARVKAWAEAKARETVQQKYAAKRDEIGLIMAVSRGLDPENLSDQQRDKIAGEAEALMKAHAEERRRITHFAPIGRVSAHDLFGKLEPLGIREEAAPDGLFIEWSRCLTDGRDRLAVLLTDDGYVDCFTAYGDLEPENIFRAIRQTFHTEIISENDPGFEEWLCMRGTTLYEQH